MVNTMNLVITVPNVGVLTSEYEFNVVCMCA